MYSRHDSIKGGTKYRSITDENINVSSVKKIFASLISIIVKLFSAKGITEKIERCIEIGSMFILESEIHIVMSAIGVSSLGSQIN